MLLTIIFLPLFGSMAAGLFGFFIGRNGSVILTTLTTFLSLFFSLIIFKDSILNNYEYIIFLSSWINSGLFTCNWSFLFDSLTMIMLIVVTSISTLVHLYSSQYMLNDPHLSRFMSYLSLFTFFMIILVTGDNFIQMFVGWEGVGFCSYLLINFWFTRLQANKAAIKAMLINRISDLILILGILTIFYNLRTVEYFSTFALIPIIHKFNFLFFNYNVNIIDVICILIFIGAMGKSAQIFLHLWLPDAMEGPTPVSALIHAATMVTAGVFLLIKCSSIFEYSSTTLLIISFFGALTSVFAASSGLMLSDIKKVIAYSTCSQLGYMVFACGFSAYNVSLFHLMNHAIFKALLFLCAGAVIHSVSNEQDMRRMGGLLNLLPLSYSSIFVASLAITGFPYLTGFFSKDIILETAAGIYGTSGLFVH